MYFSPRSKFIIPGSVMLALLWILLQPASVITPLEAKDASSVIFEVAADDDMFMIGEELVYNVSYSVFDIGIIKMQVLDTARRNGVKVFKAKAFADSYSGLPFVDLHQVFYTEMDAEGFSHFFITHNTSKPAKMPFVKYSYDYRKNKMMFEMGEDPAGVILKSGEEPVFEPQLDGLSLFFYARKNFSQLRKYSVPVLVNEKSYKTHFNFMNKRGTQKIDAIKYPVDIVEFDGTSDFTGVFGLTGYFQGYFSNDEAGVPIVAKMKVILGSVHIELIKWNKPGWIPPKAS
jgi:hypothetical protein